MKKFISIVLMTAAFSTQAMDLESAHIVRKVTQNRETFSTILPNGDKLIVYNKNGVYGSKLIKPSSEAQELFDELSDLYHTQKRAKTQTSSSTIAPTAPKLEEKK